MIVFSNSLLSNENDFIYFHKQLGNKGKRTFSDSIVVFSCNIKIKLQYFFHKYISICTIYTVLIRLISMQWSVTLLPIGKPRAVGNMASIFRGCHFKSSVWSKLPLWTETLIWLNMIEWVGEILLRCNYYHEYLACEQAECCERYILVERNWELLSRERLVILLKID